MQVASVLLWLLLPAAAVLTVLSTILWNGLELEPTPATSILYAGLHRFVWTAGVAWIALSCGFGEGGERERDVAPFVPCDTYTDRYAARVTPLSAETGIIRRILVSRFWLPFSRLSYQIYLVHFIVIYYHFLIQRKSIYFTHYNHLFTSSGVTVLSLLLAYVSFLMFEAPFAAMIKLAVARMAIKSSLSRADPVGVSMSVVAVATIDNLSFVSPDYQDPRCGDSRGAAVN